MTSSNGTVFEYDTQTYNSDRESAGGWIRSEISFPKPNTKQLIGVRAQCSGGIYIHHMRRILPDGRESYSSDAVESRVATPGSYEEQLRDALCTKRPKWQQILGK